MGMFQSLISRFLKTQFALVAVLFALGAEAKTIYVATDGTTGGDGTEASPFDTVAAAVAKAEAGDIVEIKAGTYEIIESITVDKAITVRGATGNPDEVVIANTVEDRWPNAYDPGHNTSSEESKRDKDNKIFILQDNGRIESLTMSNGWSRCRLLDKTVVWAHGSGVAMTDGVVSNCVITGGSAAGETCHTPGVYMFGSSFESCRLEDCVVRNNFNPGGNENTVGGGVCVANKGTIIGCVISNNLCRSRGGGIGVAFEAGDARIKNCVIVGNYGGCNLYYGDGNAPEVLRITKSLDLETLYQGYGSGGGGVAGKNKDTSKCEVANSLIAGNYSRKGKGTQDDRTAYGAVADAKLYGCTVLNNVSHSSNDGVKYGLDNCVAVNTIVWGTYYEDNKKLAPNFNTDTTFSSCCTTNVLNTNPKIGYIGTENLTFEEVTLNNGIFNGFTYAFKPTNAALLDAGDSQASYVAGETDIAGNDRKLNMSVDIGCYETRQEIKDFAVILDEVSPEFVSASATVNVLNTTKDLTLKLVAAMDENFSNGVVQSEAVSQSGAGEGIALSVKGLQKNTTYWLKVVVEGQTEEPSDSNVISFTTAEKPYDIDDDLTIDDRGITISLDKIYDNAELSVTVTVDGTPVTLPNNGVYTLAGEIILKDGITYTLNSVVDVDATCTFGGETYTEHYETGRILYVATSGTDNNTGKYWKKPKGTLQNALAVAKNNSNITKIILEPGRFSQQPDQDPIVLDFPISVEGESGVEFQDFTTSFENASEAVKQAMFTVDHPQAVLSGITLLGRDKENSYFAIRRGLLLKRGTVSGSIIHQFRSMSGNDGAAVKVEGGILRNCLICDCDKGKDAYPVVPIVHMIGGVMENCTVTGIATSESVPAVYAGVDVENNTHATIVNSIIYGNNYSVNNNVTTPNNLVVTDGAIVTYTSVTPLVDGEGNNDERVSFVGADKSNYHLNACTAVNSGIVLDWMTGATDLDGNPRVNGFSVDRGCYEYVGAMTPIVGFTPYSGTLKGGASQIFTAYVSGVGLEGLTYIWNFGDGTTVETDVSTVEHVFAPGRWKVKLTVKDAAKENVGIKETENNAFTMYGDVIYVSATGSGVFPYNTLEKAAQKVVTAVNDSANDFEILVAPGVYSESAIKLNKAITLRSFDPANPAEINGGNRTSDYILYVDCEGVTVRDLSFSNSKSINRTIRLMKPCVMENCIVTNNLGGGVEVSKDAVLRGSLIADNSTIRDWRGVGVNVSGGRVENCIVRGNVGVTNETWVGGGIYAGSSSTIINTLVCGNVHNYRCGGVVLDGSSVLENCTVVDNIAGKQGEGVGVYIYNANCAVRNCVIAGNTKVAGGDATDIFLPRNAANIESVCYGEATGTIPANKGNFVYDTAKPLFADRANGNYHLAANSQLINKGVALNWHTDAVDLDGKPRVLSKAVDIGCYEDNPGGMLIIIR